MSDRQYDDLLRKCVKLTLEFAAREVDAYAKNGIAVKGNHVRLIALSSMQTDFLIAATMGEVEERMTEPDHGRTEPLEP